MCFSSTASFTAAALLAIIGAFSLYKTKKKNQLMSALAPLLFAFQQASEGVVWLSLQEESYAPLQTVATYIFLTLAQVVWPVWIPTSIWLLEKKKDKKKLLTVFIMIGALIATYLAVMLMTHEVTPLIISCNLVYGWDTASYSKAGFLLFAIPIIVPFFISSVAYLWVFGLSIALSLLISYIFWAHALGSVWCFFAALLSSLIVFYLDHEKKR